MTLDEFDALVADLPGEDRFAVAGAAHKLRELIEGGADPTAARYVVTSNERYYRALASAMLFDEWATVGEEDAPEALQDSSGRPAVLHAIAPTRAKAGEEDVTLNLFGSGFATDTEYLFNGSPDTGEVVNENRMTSTIKVSGAEFEPTPGTYPVAVRNADGSVSETFAFTILPRDVEQ